jgi:photosystem II stability/assembly factor-like uncharacterized protein
MVKQETGQPRPGQILVMVGTRRGSLLLWSDPDRAGWARRAGHPEQAVHALTRDGRTGRLYAAVNGPEGTLSAQLSDDGGVTWQSGGEGLIPAPDPETGDRQIWQIQPGHAERPGEVWAGLRRASLFRSRDGGRTWAGVAGLNDHPTSGTWMGGGGGLILHTVLTDPSDARRLYACVSAGGAFRSDDDGATWRPINRGVRADFLEEAWPPTGQCMPETGQCVHKMILHPARPRVLFQQNHCGVYRSDDRGEQWHDISDGLPSRFGFGMAIHPRDPRTVYVAPLIADTNRTAPDGQLAVWRSRDDGRTWQPFTAGLPAGDRLTVLRECLATDAAEPAGVYVGTTDGRVFVSRDEGEHWEPLVDGLPPVLSVRAAVVA